MNVAETIERAPSSGADTVHVKVAVVDDHESVRLGLKAAFIEDGLRLRHRGIQCR